MTFGEKLKSLRENKNLTQVDLAKELGVTQRTISYYENGKGIPNNPETLNKLSKLFEVTLDYLLLDNEKTSNSRLHRLVKKLIEDTNKIFIGFDSALLHWTSFDKASYTCFDPDEIRDFEAKYNQLFELNDFFQFKDCEIRIKESFFVLYKNGGYLLAKIIKPSKEVVIALFLFHEDKFSYIANMNSIEQIEDLYLLVSNNESEIDKFIDDYLQDEPIPI